MTDRPPDDATASEKMEWLKDSHSEAIAEAAADLREDGGDVTATEDDD